MTIDSIREYCLSLPHTTESVQWDDDLVMKIGGKMFAIIALQPRPIWIAFKCSPDDFAELVERPGIIPSPYLARNQWVALQTKEALTSAELKEQVRRSYDLVFAKLTAKVKAGLATEKKRTVRRRTA